MIASINWMNFRRLEIVIKDRFLMLLNKKESRKESIFSEPYSANFESMFSISRIVIKETYNLAAEAYCPNHPKVLNAANFLIQILTQLNEFELAERYARDYFECQTRPIDTESKQVAIAARALAQAIGVLEDTKDIIDDGELARNLIVF